MRRESGKGKKSIKSKGIEYYGMFTERQTVLQGTDLWLEWVEMRLAEQSEARIWGLYLLCEEVRFYPVWYWEPARHLGRVETISTLLVTYLSVVELMKLNWRKLLEGYCIVEVILIAWTGKDEGTTTGSWETLRVFVDWMGIAKREREKVVPRVTDGAI